ncbi:Fic family protein [Roseivirga ehrenbergii]|uniref:Cell filamentation protein Fic n=1 Tax=Roseivirga ehrenbergii (strain DSM 102268 / JCM 13514 / KCTC 12282 / NCIMB 14502 / KMM 6017) TaxID=279360 RepID=A0A150XSV4_ROSEK|nr:Fic family protein [Roseivirga ehrenbergii]KYG81682.1 cell filamentation protein Fic [Roseivirga ehrenbergii]TCL10857.1 Fic family protein [Roseivirga ehrenbergii]
MQWNWQQKDWPNFVYNEEQFSSDENRFLHNAGLLLGSMKHISVDDQEILKVDLIMNEALKTSEIEGEVLNRDSLQSSIRKHFGLKTDQRRILPAEQGISEMMVDLYSNYKKPLDHEQLFAWHEMLTRGRRDLLDIGQYRTHDDPMQIVSGSINQPKVHFEAPPSDRVKQEMDAFIEWFNTAKIENVLIRSGIAHLYFESIHPFEDGNGRIGRALSEKVLSQHLEHTTLIAISQIIQSDKKSYYEALHANSFKLDINKWLKYFCKMVLEAQDYTQRMIDFLIQKGTFYHRFDVDLNERQSKVIDRMFREGIEGFKGGLSAENYIRITGTTSSTATRDLQKLVELGALLRKGERKSTRYFLNLK